MQNNPFHPFAVLTTSLGWYKYYRDEPPTVTIG